MIEEASKLVLELTNALILCMEGVGLAWLCSHARVYVLTPYLGVQLLGIDGQLLFVVRAHHIDVLHDLGLPILRVVGGGWLRCGEGCAQRYCCLPLDLD